MNCSQDTFYERDKAILLGDEDLKNQIEKKYSNRNIFMFEKLKQNKELLSKYKVRFEDNEKIFLEQYSEYKGKVVKSKNEFINIINKQNIFNIFEIESEQGKVYNSNIIDIDIETKINCPEKKMRNMIIKDFLCEYDLDVRKDNQIDIEENGTNLNIRLKKESYHYIDLDNSGQPYIYILDSYKSKKYIWKYSVFDIYCAVYDYTVAEAIKILSKKLDIQILSINKEIQKYYENIKKIESEFDKYTNLHKLIDTAKGVLRAINELSIERIYQSKYEGKIYIKLDYLTIGKTVGSVKSTVTPYINLFCALGLLEKKIVSNESKIKNDTTSFFIPKYNDELFKNAEHESKRLLDMKISKSGFNRDACEKAFGIEITKKIFQDNKTSKKYNKDKSGG